jgi:chromosome segregation protein
MNQLGNVIVVDNIDTLNKVGKLINYKYKVVSLDGEILFAGGALTGGTNKNNNGLLNQKYELDKLKKDLNDKKSELEKLEDDLSKLNKECDELSVSLESNQRDVILLTEQVNLKEVSLNDLNRTYNAKNNELSGTQNVKDNTLDKELESILEEYYNKQSEKEKVEKELIKFKSNKSDLATEIATLEKEYREMNYQITQKQNELKSEEVKLGKMDVKLDNLLLTLNENYGMTYEKAAAEYELDIFEGTARLTVNNLKVKIKELGEVNTGSISEYERLSERHNFLSTQRDDLESSVSSLLSVIEEMDEIMKSKFVETFEKISVEFKNVFKKLFKGE